MPFKKNVVYVKHKSYYDCAEEKGCKAKGQSPFQYHRCARKSGCRTTKINDKKTLKNWDPNSKIKLKKKGVDKVGTSYKGIKMNPSNKGVTWLSSSKIKTIPPKKRVNKKKPPPQTTKISSFFKKK